MSFPNEAISLSRQNPVITKNELFTSSANVYKAKKKNSQTNTKSFRKDSQEGLIIVVLNIKFCLQYETGL